jgi:hypothetical protein
MKFLVVLLAVLAVSNAQTCDECMATVTQLGEYLLTPEEIMAVQEVKHNFLYITANSSIFLAVMCQVAVTCSIPLQRSRGDESS